MEQDAFVAALLAAGFQQCTAVVRSEGGLLASLFLTGLVGGGAHCIGMCGPFVLSQVTARLESRGADGMREWHRLTGAALIPYHLGRTTTYVALGTVLGLAAGTLQGTFAGLRWLSALLLLLAAALFLAYALPRLPGTAGARLSRLLPGAAVRGGAGGEGWWARRIGALARPLFRSPTGLRGYGLGVMLGFIPCGLLYGALAAAASAAGPLAGALAMLAFAAGTVPSLVVVGLAGHMAGRQWDGAVRQAAPVLLLINAGILTWMAVDLMVA